MFYFQLLYACETHGHHRGHTRSCGQGQGNSEVIFGVLRKCVTREVRVLNMNSTPHVGQKVRQFEGRTKCGPTDAGTRHHYTTNIILPYYTPISKSQCIMHVARCNIFSILVRH